METSIQTVKKFDTAKSIERANKVGKKNKVSWSIEVPTDTYVWTNKMERIEIIRGGLPYESIEVISKRFGLPLKHILPLFGVVQTTYNRKKRARKKLSSRDSEVILLLIELSDLGLAVFNNEADKFQRWLKKTNGSLGDSKPESLFDSVTGIQEVNNALNRIEYGNMA